MGKEEILAMEVGLDLDKLVWTTVFGRTLPEMVFRSDVPQYSVDIVAAWQVVERLAEENLFRSIDYLHTQHWRDGKGDWRCRVVCGVKIEFAVAKEAPEAICKAALLAGEEKK